MGTQSEKATTFRALHDGPGAFILPNPWDVGTAKMLAHLGFKALATTSAGHAFSLGRADNTLGRDLTLAHAREIVGATDLPVSADLGNCFADAPETVAETIRLAASTGLAGASVEDATGRADDPVYELELAVDRVRAAADAAHGLPFPFTLTARAENFLVGRQDLFDTIQRAGLPGRRRRCPVRAGAHDPRRDRQHRPGTGSPGERAGRPERIRADSGRSLSAWRPPREHWLGALPGGAWRLSASCT